MSVWLYSTPSSMMTTPTPRPMTPCSMTWSRFILFCGAELALRNRLPLRLCRTQVNRGHTGSGLHTAQRDKHAHIHTQGLDTASGGDWDGGTLYYVVGRGSGDRRISIVAGSRRRLASSSVCVVSGQGARSGLPTFRSAWVPVDPICPTIEGQHPCDD